VLSVVKLNNPWENYQRLLHIRHLLKMRHADDIHDLITTLATPG
jgi:hypothetical protein